MCGIFGIICNESVPTKQQLHILFSYAEQRGKDGTGYSIIQPGNTVITYRSEKAYSKISDKILDNILEYLQKDSILLAICRNMPETEVATEKSNLDKTMQPVQLHNTVLVHNGAIHKKMKRVSEIQGYEFLTQIDSESITAQYVLNGRNMRIAIEKIDGGFSFLLYDIIKKRLIIGSSFLPLAQCYARGLGYIVHSDINALQELLQIYKNLKEVKYMRTWEDFYFDELQSYTIYEIDIDSMLVNSYEYRHKFTHPTWIPDKSSETYYIVLASSGIDSTTTMLTLKHLGKNVIGLHIKYGQKSQEAEHLAFLKIMEKLELPFKVVDLSSFYNSISSTSELLNNQLRVTTAEDNLKSTTAWVPVRNGLFAMVAAAIAEDLILSNKARNIMISSGYPNISEESLYPDNSQRFVDAFHNFIRFASLPGAHGRIKWINPFAGLTKKEELMLMKYFDESLFGLTVSCDRAIVKNGEVYQCSYKGQPACGSGLLSKWAAELVGIKDTRKYYEIDETCEVYKPEWKNSKNKITLENSDILIQRVSTYLKQQEQVR